MIEQTVRSTLTEIRSWLRRPASWVELAAWAALAAFVVVSLGLPLIGDGTFLNTGFFHNFAPWTDVARSTQSTTNVYNSDTIDSVTPQVSLIVDLAREGIFGQWNPYTSGGTPLGGLPDSGIYSPLSLPWWFLPLSYAPGVVKLLEIVVITVGMSLLLRRWGVPRAAWPIAALIFSSSGFMVAWTNWPQTRVAAFIPLMFWAIDRAAVELKARDVLSVGIVLSAMLLGGFPAVVGYTLFLGGIYFVVRTVVAHRSWRRVLLSALTVIGGLAFGVLLSAWQLLPFARNAVSVLDFGVRAQSGGGGSLGIGALVSSWLGDALSDNSEGPIWSGGNPTEMYSFVGIAAVVLIAAAVLIRSRQPRLAGIVPLIVGLLALSVVLVFLGGPILAAIRHLPVFDSNPIGRMRSDVGFLVAALAGIGFGKVIEPENLRDEFARLRKASPAYWIGRGVVAALVLGAAAWIAYQTRQVLFPIPAAYVHDVKIGTVWTAGIAVLTAAAVGAAWLLRSRLISVIASIGVVALVAVPATFSVQSWWPVAPTSTFYPTAPALSFLEKNLTDEQRFATSGQTTLPGSATYYQIRSLTGHTFQTAQWKQLMASIDPASAVTPTYSTLAPGNLPNALKSPLMDRLAVRYVITDPTYPLMGTQLPGPPPTATVPLTKKSPAIESYSSSGPLNGVVLNGPASLTTSAKGFAVTVSLFADDTGKKLTSTTTWSRTLQGQRYIALAGDAIPTDTAWHARITITGIDAGSSVLLGVDAAGKAAMNIVRPAPEQNIRVVHTGDATIYELMGAGNRVHWASDQTVLTTSEARVAKLADPKTPEDMVVLSEPTAHQADTSGTAQLKVDSSDVNATTVKVNATRGGWVVVEDSLQQPGWKATIDGKATKLVAADNAGGAVWVPQGEHTVELRYTTPGLSTGIVISAVSIVGAALVVTFVLILGRRRRRAAPPSKESLES